MTFMDLFGSVRCAGCGRFGAPLCSDCATGLARAGHPPSIDGVDRTIAAFAYEGPARKLVLGLKLKHLRPMARPLVEGMTTAVWRRGILGDLVTWVPGRGADIRVRGFDHAELLDRGLARRAGLGLARTLRRSIDRPDQASLGRSERLANLVDAFEAVPCDGVRVVLVDDLVTTGATAAACARALRDGGAASVEVVAACQV
jgi:ComF family protein